MLARKNYEDYLIALYFGRYKDSLTACIKRAYRDFNRTLRGIASLNGKDVLMKEVRGILKSRFESIQSTNSSFDQIKFDDWHEQVCLKLIETYSKHGYEKFSVGQAQKWINMTFKYLFTLGESRVPGFESVYSFCHVPLDNIVLDSLVKYDLPKPSIAWSKINDYNEYLDYQKAIRHKFDKDPLDVEFYLWLGKELPIKNI